ncbi:MAG: type II toxin-antitoxin system VapC family toxin [Casimicrobiaceae bacterium]
MRVVDTNVVVHLILEGDATPAARALFAADSDWRSDSFLLVEFTNVLVTAIRAGRLSARSAANALTHARRVMEPGLQAAPHELVLSLAIRHRVSAYDARFIAVADALGTRLISEDVKLRRAAPRLTQSLEQALRDQSSGN